MKRQASIGSNQNKFEYLYDSKNKFMRRYIDQLVRARGKGDFLREILFRAWNFYDCRCFKFDQVKKHMDSKFTADEMEIILEEKSKRILHNKLCRDARGMERHLLYKQRMKSYKLREIELLLMKSLGFSYRQIASELGVSKSKEINSWIGILEVLRPIQFPRL